MKMIPIPLKTVRPFIYDEIILAKPETLDFTHAEPAEYVEKTLKLKVDEMISLGNEKATGKHHVSCILKFFIKKNY